MHDPTAGAFTINPRLQRLFMTLAVDFPGQDSLMKIYGTFLNGHLKHFSADCQELGSKLIQASLANHEKVVASFRKTAVNFHYEFTVRHLSNVFQGLLFRLRRTSTTSTSSPNCGCTSLSASMRIASLPSKISRRTTRAQAIAEFFKIPGIEEFYKKDNAKPLIFCHFAGGIEEKIYNDINEFSCFKNLEDTLGVQRQTRRWISCCSKMR